MKSAHYTLSLIPALLLAACGGMPEELAEQEAAGEQASLEQGVTRSPPVFSTAWFVNGCRYALWSEQDVSPYGYGERYVFVTRESSSGCPYQRTDLGRTFGPLDPQADMRMVAGLGQLVVYFREVPLFSPYVIANFFHVAPSSLSVVRQDVLVPYLPGSDIRVAALRISSTGNFIAQGSKSGPLGPEPIDATTTQFTATYPQYFTSTQGPTLRTY